MKKLRLAALAALLVTWPSVARADSPIMEFIEGWSGPGPFFVKYTGADLRVVCLPDASASADSAFRKYFMNCWQDDTVRAKHRLMFNFNTATTDRLFVDDSTDKRTIRQTTYEVLYMYAAGKIVQAGGGLQFVHLSGPGADGPPATAPEPFGFWRTGVPMRVTIVPLGNANFPGKKQALARLLQLSFEMAYFHGEMQAADFGNNNSQFKSSNEFQGRAVINFDLSPVFNWVSPHP